ncbi:MAG: hypothetical protein ACYTKD_26860 [Planctomycetota bacterium]|jgi:hypothetical protein
MRPTVAAIFAALVAGGCGPIRFPKPTPAPELARIRERCPRFTVLSPEWIEAGPSHLAGRPLVVVGVHHQYLRDLKPWIDLLCGRGEGLAKLVIIEDAHPGMYVALAASLPGELDVHFDPPSKWDEVYAESFRLRRRADDARLDEPRKADKFERKAERLKDAADAREPGFRRALGLVGEGPHVAVIGPDGTLLALVDGPLNKARERKVTEALDAALAAAAAVTQPTDARPADAGP